MGGGTRPAVPADEVPRCITDPGWVCACPQPHLSTHTPVHIMTHGTQDTHAHAHTCMHPYTCTQRPVPCTHTHVHSHMHASHHRAGRREERGETTEVFKTSMTESPCGAERKGPEVAARGLAAVPTSALSPAPTLAGSAAALYRTHLPTSWRVSLAQEDRPPRPGLRGGSCLDCRFLMRDSMSRWPAEYCSITSITS